MEKVSTATTMNVVLAITQVVVFITMAVLNYVVTGVEGAVAYTNAQVANTHPVFGLPAGWAFAIWGIIFITLGIFTIFQAVPASCGGGLSDEVVAGVRLPTLALEVANATWLFLFGNAQFWPASVVIVIYDLLLFVVINRAAIDYFATKRSLKLKLLLGVPFSIHAGWVTVASVLQVQVNLSEEGWIPSPDFSIGCLLVAVCVASVQIYTRADIAYALASVWALGGIVTQQSAGSTFGCNTRVCKDCSQVPTLAICARSSTSSLGYYPNGWLDLCAGWNTTFAEVCFVEKESIVISWSIASMIIVLVALAVGITRSVVASCGIGGAKVGADSDDMQLTPKTSEVLNSGI